MMMVPAAPFPPGATPIPPAIPSLGGGVPPPQLPMMAAMPHQPPPPTALTLDLLELKCITFQIEKFTQFHKRRQRRKTRYFLNRKSTMIW
jgi:hypothetical protein